MISRKKVPQLKWHMKKRINVVEQDLNTKWLQRGKQKVERQKIRLMSDEPRARVESLTNRKTK